jgi:predicted DCC family thiol-disulfide oxidoreductase YuxK
MDKQQHPIIFFDGVCVICNYWVDFLLKRDSGLYLFASLQGVTAQKKLDPSLLNKDLKTLVLWDQEGVFIKSQAILRIFSKLSSPWKWLNVLNKIPTRWLDAGYDFFSSHRYQWFGQKEVCRIPSPADRIRFLE